MSTTLVIAQLLLLLLGLIGVATSRPDLVPDHASKVLVAILVTFVLSRLRPRAFLRMALPFFLLSLVLLVLVLFIGEGGNDSPVKRWLDFGGPFRFQPSEFAKLALVLQLASFFSRRGTQKKLISATGMIFVTTALVLFEPDLGTTILTFTLGVVLIYSAGVRLTSVVAILFVATLGALPFASIYLEKHPYILERVKGHSEEKLDERPQGSTQIDLAHRDMQRGGLYGQGPDGPRYRYSADHTDLVIASVAFSTGLLGVATVIFAYWLVVQSGLSVADLAGRIRPLTPELHGASIMATGAMFMIVSQAFVNLAVAVGLLPVTGVPLPLVSYGFSSLLAKSVAFAVMHSAIREVHRHAPKPVKTPTVVTDAAPEVLPNPAD
ncbi:FtsW/RodA/SpoVE family cell cycle protein [Deinococcus pimensis]|uniref:FtsW/RodA/SpoVE family cell cycle protein n=1 Tax=Deinococcus pimensis TaxID=309888 RepID=UPI00048792B1|nr:FtsW/RodA/SpoVE family cell cycle protein [Deinococcus pimensis]